MLKNRAVLFDADGAALRLDLPAARVDALRIWVTDATRGRSTLKCLD